MVLNLTEAGHLEKRCVSLRSFGHARSVSVQVPAVCRVIRLVICLTRGPELTSLSSSERSGVAFVMFVLMLAKR